VLIVTFGSRGGEWPGSRTSHFTSGTAPPIPIEQEAVWALAAGLDDMLKRKITYCCRKTTVRLRLRKVYRTNAAIWYNKICRQKQLTPSYINIRIKGKNQQCQNTLRTAKLYHINQQIKFLSAKKSKLNEQLFHLHLKWANDRNSIWPVNAKSIEEKLSNEMESHYNNLNKKQKENQARKKCSRVTSNSTTMPEQSI